MTVLLTKKKDHYYTFLNIIIDIFLRKRYTPYLIKVNVLNELKLEPALLKKDESSIKKNLCNDIIDVCIYANVDKDSGDVILFCVYCFSNNTFHVISSIKT